MEVDLEKITRKGRAMFLAYDQGMEHGPEMDFDDENVDPADILKIAESGYSAQGGSSSAYFQAGEKSRFPYFTGVIFQKGIAEKYYNPKVNKIPLIVKLNGKTRLRAEFDEPYSPQLCSVEEAVELGAAAVGYTIYTGSKFENKMMQEFSSIEQEVEKYKLPVIAWTYPRGQAVAGKERSREVLAYAARIGLELGADIIKIPYNGNKEDFKWIVKSAGRTKVVMSGGPKTDKKGFFQNVKDVLEAGAIGIAVGRNIWQDDKPLEISQQLAKLIFS